VNPRRPAKGGRPGRVGWLVISSFLWHLTRWDGLFLGTYLVTHFGGRPIDDQLVGIAMFAPMLLGSIVAGHLRKGLDPRLVVLVCEITLLPLAAAFPFLAGSRAAAIWIVYPFEFAFGVGGMVNMTAQRELLARTAGPQRQRRVLSAELTGMSGAMMLGPLIGGISIGLLGIGPAFGVTAVLLAGSVTILRAASRPATVPAPSPPSPSPSPSLPVASGSAETRRRSLRQLLGHRRLAFVLGVTVVANLCYFAFTPLVPVVAKRLQAGPAVTGVLGSAAGAVQLVVAAVLVAWPARRAGAVFAAGVGLCLACLGALAYAPDVLVAVLVLATAGIGQGLFNSLQTLLTVSSVPRTDRPAAFGVLTTTIGVALPLGMLVLGISSSLFGAQAGMLVSSLTGLAVLAVIAGLNWRALAVGDGGDEADQAVEVLPAAGSVLLPISA
jgi:predicted MFS family arabinose efflux permease